MSGLWRYLHCSPGLIFRAWVWRETTVGPQPTPADSQRARHAMRRRTQSCGFMLLLLHKEMTCWIFHLLLKTQTWIYVRILFWLGLVNISATFSWSQENWTTQANVTHDWLFNITKCGIFYTMFLARANTDTMPLLSLPHLLKWMRISSQWDRATGRIFVVLWGASVQMLFNVISLIIAYTTYVKAGELE